MASDGSIRVWAADPLVKVLPDMAPPADATSLVRIDAVRNECESAQIVVTARERIEKLSVNVGALTGPAGASPRIRARFVGFVPVRGGSLEIPPEYLVAKPPVDIPDPLLEQRWVSVEAGSNQPVWLTVYVPKTASPGVYRGSVEISADGAGTTAPIQVTVHKVTLPDDRTLFVTNWFDDRKIARAHGLERWSEPYWRMLGTYAAFMAEHRQNVVLVPLRDVLRAREDRTGSLTFDFTLFDRWVEVFRKAGVVGYIEGSHLGGRKQWEAEDFIVYRPEIRGPDGSVKPPSNATVTSEEQRRYLSQFLPSLEKHLEEKGWLSIYFQHLCDEPIPVNAASYRKAATYVREYGPRIKVMDAVMCTELTGALDVWVPLPGIFDREMEFFRERQRAGEQVWFYTCLNPKGRYMNRFLDQHLVQVRLLHWVNFKYGLTGYLHWGLNKWGEGDPFKEPEPGWETGKYLPPGDSFIIYPGKRGPLSSIRMESMRDGLEDYELLRLLAKKDSEKAHRICDSVAPSLTDYTLDPAVFRRARARLIRALEEVMA